MAISQKSRRITGLAAAAVVAATALSTEAAAAGQQTGAFETGALADPVALVADFEDMIAAKAGGGTVIPVTVEGGTVGDSAKAFAALRITAKIGETIAPVAWVDATHLKVTAPPTTRATAARMRLLKAGVAGPESTDQVGYTPGVAIVAPAVLNAGGGATVTITGTGFLGVDATNPESVKFGEVNATSFTVLSAVKITAVAPAGSNGVTPVRVVSTGGASPVTATSRVNYRAPLGLSGTPVAKATGGQVVLTVTGAELGADVKAFTAEKIAVVVGSRTLQPTYIDENRMRINVPAASTDTVPVKIIHDGIAGEPATITMAPVVVSVSTPTGSVAGGKKVTIRAAGANLAEATDFRFGDKAATCVKQGTSTALSFLCTVPPADAPGPVQIGFTTGNGKTSRFTAAATFSYTVN